MELGGKSPAIVFADADLDAAIDSTLFGVFSLNGERCTAGCRILVERAIYDDFVDAYAARAKSIVVGDPHDPTTEVGALVHPGALRQGDGLRRDRQDRGPARRRRRAPGGPARAGNYVSPTVFADVAARRADLPGGDLRSGRRDHAVRQRRRSARAGQRREVRPGRLHLDHRPEARAHTSRRTSRPAWCGSTPTTCATCAPRSAASRPPASATRAATAPSTSTPTSRPCTSRSAPCTPRRFGSRH